MSDYLNYKFQDTPEFMQSFDEAPLWSMAFGLFLLEELDLIPEGVLADIGSGAGFPLLELAGRLGPSVKLYGLDPWQNAQDRAALKIRNYGYEHVELLKVSAESIPLLNESVDLITSNLGINNFENPEKVFRECHRVMKPGAKLAFTTNLKGHWHIFYRLFESVLDDLNMSREKEALLKEESHRSTVDGLKKMVSNCDFKVEKVVERRMKMKFLNGSAFMNHHFIRPGWLGSWLGLIAEQNRARVFCLLEEKLNQHAAKEGGLLLEVPMLYMEIVKP